MGGLVAATRSACTQAAQHVQGHAGPSRQSGLRLPPLVGAAGLRWGASPTACPLSIAAVVALQPPLLTQPHGSVLLVSLLV